MSKIILLPIFSLFLICHAQAVIVDVSVSSIECDGPFRTKGDIRLMETAISSAKAELEAQCAEIGRGFGILVKKSKISAIEIQDNVSFCIKFEATDKCYFR